MGGKKLPLQYARSGFKIFPIKAGAKKPPLCSWRDESTTDTDQVQKWFSQDPTPNVGIPTGENNLIVLDVDGPEGKKSHRKIAKEQPPTPTVETPHGVHYIYRAPEDIEIRNSAGEIAPGIDIRGEGGYIVAPPSRLETENGVEKYKWFPFLSLLEKEPAELPPWLLHRLTTSQDQGGDQGGDPELIDLPGEKKEANYYDPEPGDIICPLFKYEDKFGTGPLEAPGPGQRNEWLFYQALTHFNLGLSENYFRAVFYQKVWPKMKKAPGHDGEKFTSQEAHGTIKNAKKAAEKFQAQGKQLSPRVIDYHTYKDAQNKDQGGDQGGGQVKRWTTRAAKLEIMSYILRFQPSYATEQTGPAYQQLARDVAEYSDETGKRGKIPRRTLARALKQLRETGIITTITDREGTGYVIFSCENRDKKDPSVPVTPMNGVLSLNQRESCGRARDPDDYLRGPPPDGELKTGIQDLIDENNGQRIPKYPGLEQKRKNAGKTRIPSAVQGVHILAWITEDPDFATWCYVNEPLELWPAIRDYVKYQEEIQNSGAWLRSRIMKKEATG